MSAQSPPSVHYEVYTQSGGARWNLHARYEKSEREAALADAKQVEKSLQIPAKVVRETYYPSNNTSEETLVYAGDAALRAKVKERASAIPRHSGGGRGGGTGGGGGAGGGGYSGAAAQKQSAAARAATAGAHSLLKLLIVLAASLTVAGTATGLMDAMMNPIEFNLSQTVWSGLLFATFVVCFIGAALPLAKVIMNANFLADSGTPLKPAAMPASGKPAKTPSPKVVEVDLTDLIDDDEFLPPEEAIEPEPEPELEAEPLIEAEADAEAAEGEMEAEPQGEPGPVVFVRFVNALIQAVRAKRPTLDAYNLFGLDLIMAGAIDVLGQNRNIDAEERRNMLKGAIEAMGVKAVTAQAFADKYEAYLGEPKYLPMILAGRSSMEAQLAGHDTMAESVGPAFDLWNKPKSQAQPVSSRIMTVMFTDMVGSTDMTQALGDHAAQKIVRRHNAIVRHALAEYEGKEIKHTGDGIMCSFSSAAGGIEAAIAIQRAIARHNAQAPDLPLHVRIGINSGEPVEEEDDIFGGTVQLSARVCARCDTDEILCSNVVKELAAGRSFDFTSLGPQPLKGFKEPIVLYQVEWRDRSAAAAASASPS